VNIASADRAAEALCDAVVRIGEPFAHDHADLRAMIHFVETGRQTTRTELFQAIFVPVALMATGQDAEARDALAQFAQTLRHDQDRQRYAEVARALGA
jgi:hypothetical protein